ncbi:MAG: CopG family transcriptional regulator [Planctomycetota bacterium]
MARVNLYLADNLLAEVGEEAKTSGLKRSTLVQQALQAYLKDRHHVREEEDRRRRMAEAVVKADRVAEKLGKWDPQPLIRSFRDTRGKSS